MFLKKLNIHTLKFETTIGALIGNNLMSSS